MLTSSSKTTHSAAPDVRGPLFALASAMLLLPFSATAAFTTSEARAVPLENPSFEAKSQGWQVSSRDSCRQGPTPVGAHTGSIAWEMQVAATGRCAISQDFAVVPGEAYLVDLHAWVASGRLLLTLQNVAADGQPFGSASGGTTTGIPGERIASAGGAAQTGAAKLRFTVVASGTHAGAPQAVHAFIDDVKVWRIERVSRELGLELRNGGFESGEEHWQRVYAWDGCRFEPAATPIDGSVSLLLTNAAAGGFCTITQSASAQPGATYTLRAQQRIDDPTTGAGRITIRIVSEQTEAVWKTRTLWSPGLSTIQTAPIVAPADATRVEVTLEALPTTNLFTDSVPTPGRVVFDRVELVRS